MEDKREIDEVDEENLAPFMYVNDVLEIRLPRLFRDVWWANSIGRITKEINSYAGVLLKSRKQVIFDFSKCRWIDPIPLMSMLLEIAKTCELHLYTKLRVPTLPTASDRQIDREEKPYLESPARLLWFLTHEGFIDCIEKLGKVECDGISSWSDFRKICESMCVKPSYEDARCIPMHIFSLPNTVDHAGFANEKVDFLLEGVEVGLASKIPAIAKDRLLYKLRVTLQELVHNAQEHAYDSTDKNRLVAVYVRYRTGGLRLESMNRLSYQDCMKEELKHCPMLLSDWLNVRSGCLEVFVVDCGRGMVHSFESKVGSLSHRYKLDEIIRMTFIDGQSAKPERQTLFGGLHLLHNILSKTSDYLRVVEGDTWFGCGVPIIRDTMTGRKLTDPLRIIPGLGIHLRLGWLEDADNGPKWISFSQNEKNELWDELALDASACFFGAEWMNKQIVIDERFGYINIPESKATALLWLVRPHRMKWDIITFLERVIVPHAKASGTMLVIADIPSYEAETYVAALAEFKASGTTDWPSRFSHVVLVTNRWRFAAMSYKKYKYRHGFSNLDCNLKGLTFSAPYAGPAPKSFRLAIVRWIRWHDSCRFWEEVNRCPSLFVAERINWSSEENGKGKSISGYIDFAGTIHNRLCSNLYHTALARVLGILDESESIFAIDRFSSTLLGNVFAVIDIEDRPTTSSNLIALGSVLISGTTLKASISGKRDLHFFVHCDSEWRSHKSALFFWLPRREISAEPPRYARIGTTASIAVDGWKSFEVPRFDSKGNCLCKRAPDDTYKDWQSASPVILKLGHWSYEGHHDFLTVNLVSAVNASFNEMGDLARYLVRSIFPAIGIEKKHVQRKWHRLFDNTDGQEPTKSEQNGYGLLIYRSHPGSDSVITRLLDLLTPEARNVACTRVFPIVPLRRRWSGSAFLIPPVVRAEIIAALRDGEKMRSVLLFDDASVSGRTLHDLRASLSAIGSKDIRSMVIVNRLRQPADSIQIDKLDYYWRLDVPVMGRDGNCPFCHALHLVERFSKSLSSCNAKTEITSWLTIWGTKSPMSSWSSGLRPLPLQAIETKSFCYRQGETGKPGDGKYLAQISLNRSTGVVLHAAELHAMTGRDDYGLSRIKAYNQSEIRVEIATSQFFLFGDEFDQDVRVELVKILVNEITRVKDSAHASLAVLAVLGGLSLLNEEARKQVATAVLKPDWHQGDSYVIKVLLAYLVREGLISSGSDAYDIGKRLLATATLSLSQKFNAWFLETFSPTGNAHTGPIPFLLEDLRQGSHIHVRRIRDALDSLDYLTDLVSGIEKGLVRHETTSLIADRVESMSSAGKQAKLYLEQLLDSASFDDGPAQCVKALKHYISEMGSLAECYFHRIPSTQEYYRNNTFETSALSNIIISLGWGTKDASPKPDNTHGQNRVVVFSAASIIGFKRDSGEVWIAWNRCIEGIVSDLIGNARHVKDQILDPWDVTCQDMAHMWILLRYRETSVEIDLANASALNPDQLRTELEDKSWRFSPLRELGGDIACSSPKPGIVSICVRIPYAGYLTL